LAAHLYVEKDPNNTVLRYFLGILRFGGKLKEKLHEILVCRGTPVEKH
jgi:hypothetical protein